MQDTELWMDGGIQLRVDEFVRGMRIPDIHPCWVCVGGTWMDGVQWLEYRMHSVEPVMVANKTRGSDIVWAMGRPHRIILNGMYYRATFLCDGNVLVESIIGSRTCKDWGWLDILMDEFTLLARQHAAMKAF